MNTIVALATPPLKSTIHIIRLSGPDTYKIINNICSDEINKTGNTIDHNKIFNKETKKIIDDVLLMKFVKPKSFTGEDLIEINCHGNMMIVDQIISLILKHGATMAEPGEFTKQAFLNNKLDLSQANSINYLINAKSNLQIDVSLDNILGKSKNKINDLKKKLFEIIGTIKVNIDYPEYYDVEDIKNKKILTITNEINGELKSIINSYSKNFFLFNNINLAILGKPNSGKSSLLNSLLNYERSIVSEEKGTTRDFVKESVNIEGLNFNIIDTAGIRDTNNLIEQKGIQRAIDISKDADIVLYMIDTSKKIPNEELDWIKKNLKKRFIIVKNKIDLNDSNEDIDGIKISTKNNDIDNLKKELKEIFKYSSEDNFFIVSDYEKNILLEINNNLEEALKLIESNISQDLILPYLEAVYMMFNKFLGEDKDIDLLDELFKNFCLGK